MRRAVPLNSGTPDEVRRSRALVEVETLAWLLDNSIPIPLTGGRRLGLDAIVGLVPIVGDLVSGALGLVVVWRASRMGLPRIVVTRMLANSAVDLVIGAIPVLGDAFDLWFKANTRNLGLMRRHLEEPASSTRNDWLVVGSFAGMAIAVVVLLGWLIISVVAAVVGLFA